jgi:hypothetical protein
VTPKRYVGRMIAVLTPVVTAASMISVVLAGSLASTALRGFHASVAGLRIGPIDTIFTMSAILILAAGVFGYVALPPAEARLADVVIETDLDDTDLSDSVAAPSIN